MGALGEGAGGQVGVVGGAEEEDSFPVCGGGLFQRRRYGV